MLGGNKKQLGKQIKNNSVWKDLSQLENPPSKERIFLKAEEKAKTTFSNNKNRKKWKAQGNLLTWTIII